MERPSTVLAAIARRNGFCGKLSEGLGGSGVFAVSVSGFVCLLYESKSFKSTKAIKVTRIVYIPHNFVLTSTDFHLGGSRFQAFIDWCQRKGLMRAVTIMSDDNAREIQLKITSEFVRVVLIVLSLRSQWY